MEAFPHELIDLIVNFLNHDLPALRASSLVSQKFLPSCRRRLFATINLKSRNAVKGFPNFVISSPHVLVYAKALSFVQTSPLGLEIISAMKQLPSLTKVELCYSRCPNNTRLVSTFSAPPFSSRLTHLSVANAYNFPIALLFECKALQHLWLNFVHIEGFPGEKSPLEGNFDGQGPQLKTFQLSCRYHDPTMFAWLVHKGCCLGFSKIEDVAIRATRRTQYKPMWEFIASKLPTSVKHLDLGPPPHGESRTTALPRFCPPLNGFISVSYI